MLYYKEEEEEMIEVAIREYLENNLVNIPVVMEYPKNPAKKFILLQLADGGQVNHIDAATFFVTVYADSLYEAAELKDKVKSFLLDATSLSGITKASLGQEQADTDSANHVYKYNLTFNFYYYREET